jgi:flagellin FlaA/flagellin FlaB
MQLNLFDIDDRGQVGIGTLIVFIAMVLVAAIAAGVLINTAGFLQTQSQATGTESTEQVANNIEILSVTGQVDNGNEINQTRLVVQKTAGSNAIDLNETTVQWLGPDGATTLTHNVSPTAGQNFNTSAITDSDSEVLNQRDDRIEIIINHTVGGTVDYLAEGEEVDVTLTLQSGSQRSTVLTVPDSLNAESDGDDIRL